LKFTLIDITIIVTQLDRMHRLHLKRGTLLVKVEYHLYLATDIYKLEARLPTTSVGCDVIFFVVMYDVDLRKVDESAWDYTLGVCLTGPKCDDPYRFVGLALDSIRPMTKPALVSDLLPRLEKIKELVAALTPTKLTGLMASLDAEALASLFGEQK
jgi:hypothetical protein